MHFMGKLGLEKVSKRSRRDPDHEKTFLTFTLSVNKIILYQFSMFKSLDSIASVVGMFMYLTISKLKQVLRSRKGLGKVSTTTLDLIMWGIILSQRVNLKLALRFRALLIVTILSLLCYTPALLNDTRAMVLGQDSNPHVDVSVS